jgi:3-hydroxybutyryl-CoA dehydratase
VAVVSDRIEVRYAPTQPVIDAWAQLSGDHNPLHVDPVYAATTRFGGTIAHGHLALAYMQRAMLDLFGRRWLHGGALEGVRFTAPVRPGEEYVVVAQPEDGRRRWTVEVSAMHDRTVCAAGTASLPSEETS